MSKVQKLSTPRVGRTVWWIKRDIRLTDNHCLYWAAETSDEVIPFFCWEPTVLNAGDFGSFHLQAQWQALEGLSASLQIRGSGLVERIGEVVDELDALFKKYPFQRIRSYQETGNDITFRRDQAVKRWCREHGVQWVESVGSTVIRGISAEQKRKRLNKNPRGRLPVLPIPKNLCPPQERSLFAKSFDRKKFCSRFPKFSGPILTSLQTVNERSAWSTLESFLQKRGVAYAGGISSPNTAFSAGSRLSPHLAWGTISSGSVFDALDHRMDEIRRENGPSSWRRSLRAFESRMHWRDHFIQRLEGNPQMEFHPINSAYDSFEYEDDSNLLSSWIHGQTGYPMIDACMRCLGQTGFVNFRMRAMVVSFACFGLHLSWRTIHGPLAQIFLDYEPGIHLSQLQMQAGITGINAIRVYSPAKQFLDHDRGGDFVKRWVPELRNRTPAEIAHAEEVNLSGYVPPVVRLKQRTKEMKDRIFFIRKSEFGKNCANVTLKRHGSRKGMTGRRIKEKSEEAQLSLFKD